MAQEGPIKNAMIWSLSQQPAFRKATEQFILNQGRDTEEGFDSAAEYVRQKFGGKTEDESFFDASETESESIEPQDEAMVPYSEGMAPQEELEASVGDSPIREPSGVKSIDEGLEHILEVEAGYQDQTEDTGNYIDGKLIGTNRGITPEAYKEFYGKVPTVEDMKNLTKAQALEIYKSDYVSKPKFDLINDPNLQTAVVDFGVNSGPTTAVKMLQKLIGAEEDGLLGPDTLEKVNNYEGDILSDFYDSRREFINNMQDGPKKEKYQKGWLNRIDEMEKITTPEVIEKIQKAIDREAKQLGTGAGMMGSKRSSLDDLMGQLADLNVSDSTKQEMEESAFSGDMDKLQDLVNGLKS
jgi:lysozyme family protein